MKQNEFALLAGAGAIETVTVYRDPAGGGWQVWTFAEGMTWTPQVEAARGGVREWASLDTAYSWIRAQGWKASVSVSETSPYAA